MKNKGITNGLLSGFLWAINGLILGSIFNSVELQSVSNLAIFALLIACFNDLGAGLLLLIKNGFSKTVKALKTTDGLTFIASGIIAGPIAMSCYVLSIQQLSAVHALVLTSLFPVVSVSLGLIFKHETFSRSKLIALFLAILGIIVMGLDANSKCSTAMGVVLAIICMFGWGIEGFIVKRSTSKLVDATDAITIRELTSGISYLILLPFIFGSISIDVAKVFFTEFNTFTILLAAASAAASYLCWYKSIYAIGIAKADTLNITYGIFSVMLGWLFNGFTGISLYIAASAVLIFIASAIVIKSEEN